MLSLPVPLYPEPPYTYDEAKVAIAFLDNPLSSVPPGLLPEGIEYLPLQVAVFADYPDSTIGPYREVVVLVGVMRNGNPALYCPATGSPVVARESASPVPAVPIPARDESSPEISLTVFHSPQCGQHPIHFGCVAPQLLHSKKCLCTTMRQS